MYCTFIWNRREVKHSGHRVKAPVLPDMGSKELSTVGSLALFPIPQPEATFLKGLVSTVMGQLFSYHRMTFYHTWVIEKECIPLTPTHLCKPIPHISPQGFKTAAGWDEVQGSVELPAGHRLRKDSYVLNIRNHMTQTHMSKSFL